MIPDSVFNSSEQSSLDVEDFPVEFPFTWLMCAIRLSIFLCRCRLSLATYVNIHTYRLKLITMNCLISSSFPPFFLYFPFPDIKFVLLPVLSTSGAIGENLETVMSDVLVFILDQKKGKFWVVLFENQISEVVGRMNSWFQIRRHLLSGFACLPLHRDSSSFDLFSMISIWIENNGTWWLSLVNRKLEERNKLLTTSIRVSRSSEIAGRNYFLQAKERSPFNEIMRRRSRIIGSEKLIIIVRGIPYSCNQSDPQTRPGSTRLTMRSSERFTDFSKNNAVDNGINSAWSGFFDQNMNHDGTMIAHIMACLFIS